MKKPYLKTIIATVRKLNEQAEEYRKNGKLIKASNLTLKVDELLAAWQKKRPASKILQKIGMKNEICRNRIIHDMIKSIHLEHNIHKKP
ncbi:hypothetical protein [Alkalitalea saponilacus]|uniref:Uncharacterized protein n=1 Tax=Alkalitalea saponilacus TaxID=889453 RepID=A0A1T5D533_9BACT|nr:hypothetical protein [Alkalitalea saponilacus]ASB50575.1 hypothetical protein CDL62_16200 [Alkalitalea saponilacus]SKB66653.1 hypothetical protein SAMN03080601_00975 [Alkalitalea saponilacus]